MKHVVPSLQEDDSRYLAGTVIPNGQAAIHTPWEAALAAGRSGAILLLLIPSVNSVIAF